jgi:DNA polymerase-3 subunit gamma/tau
MSQTIYRKYRPQSFKELIGQNHIKTTLQNELESGKIAHAFLFSGPRGLGKTTTARLLAKAVNCLKRKAGESEPCNACDSCREIVEARSLDIIEIDAASHTGVDNVRENIIASARFTPTSRKYKVFIIDEVHMLSISAFNALLKTLEEPPAHAIFILATTEIHKVPETIISRCQHFEFHKVAQPEIIVRLNQIVSSEGKKVEKEVIENIAYASGGCLRDAESLLGQILTLDDKEITAEQAELVLPRSRFDLALNLVDYLNRQDIEGAITLINDLVEDGVELEKFTGDLIEVLRKIMLVKINRNLGAFGGSLNKDLEKRIIEISERTALDFLIKAIEILIKKKQELKYSDIAQLPLELAVLEIAASESGDNDQDRRPPPTIPGKKIGEAKPAAPAKKAAEPVLSVADAPKPEKGAETAIIDLAQIRTKWESFLVCLKKYNQSLASMMKICVPLKIDDDGALEVSFANKFYQQRFNEQKNRQILEKALEEVFGVKVLVKATVAEAVNFDIRNFSMPPRPRRTIRSRMF